MESSSASSGFFLDAVGRAVVIGFFGPHDLKFMQRTRQLVDGLDDEGLVSMLIYVGHKAAPPDDITRRGYAHMMRDYASRSAGVAYVIPGEGFAAAVQRGVVTSLDVLSRNENRTLTCKSLAAAVDFLVEGGMDRATQEAAVARLRAAMDTQPE
mgnify:CR=1 FL=1